MNRILKNFVCLLVSLGMGLHASGQSPTEVPSAPTAAPDQISQLAEMVGLSEAQEAQIRSIIDEIEPQIETLQGEAQTVQTELSEMAGPDFDEAAIRVKAAELGKIQGEMTALSIILQSKVDSVFTEEQRQNLEAIQRQQQQQMMQQQQMQRQMQQQMQQRQQQQPPAQP